MFENVLRNKIFWKDRHCKFLSTYSTLLVFYLANKISLQYHVLYWYFLYNECFLWWQWTAALRQPLRRTDRQTNTLKSHSLFSLILSASYEKSVDKEKKITSDRMIRFKPSSKTRRSRTLSVYKKVRIIILRPHFSANKQER